MSIKRVTMTGLVAAALLLSGCGALGGLTGGGGVTAAALWPDVPPMEGMTKENIEVPLPLRLAAQGMMQASAGQEGLRLDNVEVIAYTTEKTTDDVQAFYTTERMRAAGWNAGEQPGCFGASEAQVVSGGAFCMFGKDEDRKQSLLAIIATRSENDPRTTLFFMRVDGDLTTTPSAN